MKITMMNEEGVATAAKGEFRLGFRVAIAILDTFGA